MFFQNLNATSCGNNGETQKDDPTPDDAAEPTNFVIVDEKVARFVIVVTLQLGNRIVLTLHGEKRVQHFLCHSILSLVFHVCSVFSVQLQCCLR